MSQALFDAAFFGKVETLEKLAKMALDFEATDSRGYSALHFAAQGGKLESVRWLLEHGANPNHLDRFGNTPLFRAVYAKHADIVKLLREKGADPLLGGTAQFARSWSNPMKELFADLPDALPEVKKQEVVVMTEGRIPDGPPGAKWQQEHDRLWKLLVPARAEAPTLQGELIRCTGRLASEAFRNGNINWDARFEDMCRFIGDAVGEGDAFDKNERLEIRTWLATVKNEHRAPDLSGEGSAYYRLSEAAVKYCQRTPELRPYSVKR
ncbi:MAG: ankyrin repeat domain-containing protein [Archangium sp.]